MKKLTLKTEDGCRRLLAIFLVILLLASCVARVVQTDGGKIKVEKVNFDSRGASINAELYYPAYTSDRDSLPGIVVTHGGGCTLGVTKGMSQELARRGFVVLNVSAYGTGFSDQPIYDEANQGQDGFNMMVAINGLYDSLCYLRTLRFVDPTRIGTIGHSMGAMRTLGAAAIDAGYLTFNDIMINELYNEFGQTFTEEEIGMDADTLAEERLNDDQLAHYNSLKEANWEVYNTRVKAEIPLGIGGGMSPLQSEVEVAGYTVKRSIQTNIAYMSGDFDSMFGFQNDNTNAAWYEENFKAGDWYSIDDVTASSINLGSFNSIDIQSDVGLAEAVANRTTRLVQSTGRETHSKEFFSSSCNATVIRYFTQVLGYNRGDLGAPGSDPIADSNQTWLIRAICNFISMLCVFGIFIALTGLLTKKKFFADVVCPVDDTVRAPLNKGRFWIFSALAALLGFIGIYMANKNGLFFFSPSRWLPLGRTAVLTIYFLIVVSIGTLILLACYFFFNKKAVGDLGIKNLNVAISLRKILKNLLLVVILIGAGYAVLSISEYFFGQDFRLWMAGLSDMKVEWWTVGLHYFVILFPMYLIISAGVNFTIRTDLPEWQDTLVTVLVNSVGVWLCCILNILIAKASYNGTLFSSFICSYQFVFWVPLTTYIARKMYKLTGNIWSGAFLNAAIITWAMMSALGVNDDYFGPYAISNFFNV
ncbi:MAG: hypothetical protein IJJ67_03110 [Oscillospiraceae bacterium]|nr:hypothetical protein [Oscillospiraceae bacterium]